jgi:hypothetical protein
MDKNMILGYCGLYCGGCGIYQGTQDGNPVRMEDGSPKYCDGCASERTTEWCTNCGIRECNREKGIRYCLECRDVPCEMLTQFMEDPRYPYHREVLDNMKRLRKVNLDKWAEEMDRRYTCKSCKRHINWFDKKCPHCGKAV